MEYYIVDYMEPERHGKGKNCIFFKHLRKYIKLKQLKIERKQFLYDDMKCIVLVIPMGNRDLRRVPVAGLQKKLRCEMGDFSWILLSEPVVRQFLPGEVPVCEDVAEIFLPILRGVMPKILEERSVCRKYARLLVLDDGSADVSHLIQELAEGWNYVTVCSVRQQELEDVYAALFEEEGLMVQAVVWDWNMQCEGDVVVDLTADYKGIHRMYPKGSIVLDVNLSHEKERYLLDKGRTDIEYMPVCELLQKYCENEFHS